MLFMPLDTPVCANDMYTFLTWNNYIRIQYT